MIQSRWTAVAALLGVCLVAPAARAQNAPPPPPGAAPARPVLGTAASGTTPGVAAPAKPVPLPGVLTVMVFQFDNATPNGGIALGQALADAVGRGMETYDRCTIKDICVVARKDDLRFSVVVNALVRSDAFQKRRAKRPEEMRQPGQAPSAAPANVTNGANIIGVPGSGGSGSPSGNGNSNRK